MTKKIVLIGAGSMSFGFSSVGNILASKVLEGSTICLHDINAKSLDVVSKVCQSAIDKKKLNFTLESTINRKEALKKADFVISSIEVKPRFDLWDQDYEIPRKFGNRQIFGENGGPGGLFHSLRIIPEVLDICEDVSSISPNALFINYSNPMSRVCLAIKRKYPALKMVGLCHEITMAIINIPRYLNTKIANLQMYAGGLNHFGVVLDLKYRDTGKDAYPDLKVKSKEIFNALEKNEGISLVKYVFDTYGYFPYTYDSHYGEYIQWAWEKADIKQVLEFYDFARTISEFRYKSILKKIERGKAYRVVKPDPEEAIPIIEAIINDSNYEVSSVNLPNDDVFTNLPKDLVIECPAIVDKDGIHAIKYGEYPKGIAALLRNQASVQDLVVEA
ncbi:MAG: alpha-glucosidase, partial [archaeon]|nr:alpha-glucosidase [archaeon]